MRSQSSEDGSTQSEAFDSGLIGTESAQEPPQPTPYRQYDPPPFRQAPVLDNPHTRAPRPEYQSKGFRLRNIASGRSTERPRRIELGRQRQDGGQTGSGDPRQTDSEKINNITRRVGSGDSDGKTWGHLPRKERHPDEQRTLFRYATEPKKSSDDQNNGATSTQFAQEDAASDYRRGFVSFRPNSSQADIADRAAIVRDTVKLQHDSDGRAGRFNEPPENESTQTINTDASPGDITKMRRRATRFASDGEEDLGTSREKEHDSKRRGRRDQGEDDMARVPKSRTAGRVSQPARRSRQTKAAVSRVAQESSFDREEPADDDRSAARRRRKETKEQQRREKAERSKEEAKAGKAIPIQIPPFVSIQNLAALLRVRPEDFSSKLEELGFKDVSMDYVLNAETAGLIAMEYNFEPVAQQEADLDLKARPLAVDKSSLPQRPPIVTIMGHVDHGKTTLLDYLRHSSVAASEHGGITQHIGAFSVPLESHNNRLITFLDTPGHSAFLTMRQRGANVTDIVVLVVAADDSVKPQTIEAIKHSKSAGVQIIVAINKVDKEEADVHKVKQDLMRHEIEVEDFGGDIQAIEVSGKTGQGVADLEEAIITLADVLDVRAEKDGAAEGWVLEAATKRAGRSATVLVRRGTLRTGDVIIAGKTWARARTLRNEAGALVDHALPGTPVEIDGWRDQPMAGDEVLEAPSEQKATSVVEFREARDQHLKALTQVESTNEARKMNDERRAREKQAVEEAKAALEARENATRKEKMEARKAAIFEANKEFRDSQPQALLELFIVVKADVSGSAEAVATAIDSLPLANQPIKVSILRSGVGALSESDIALAAAAPEGQGFVLNFNQDVPPAMSVLAAKSNVTLLDANIIYKVIDLVREKVEDWLPPVITTRVTGEAQLVQAFDIQGEKKTSTRVAGCRVSNGIVSRNSKARVYRGEINEGASVFTGKSLNIL